MQNFLVFDKEILRNTDPIILCEVAELCLRLSMSSRGNHLTTCVFVCVCGAVGLSVERPTESQ